jgi:tetratricopeptide (TPR) repeat protein
MLQRDLIATSVILALTGMCPRIVAQETDSVSKVHAEAAKSVFTLVVKSDNGDVIGKGLGFLVQGGKILTNAHVVRSGNVYIHRGAVELPVVIERVDIDSNLALLTARSELALRPLAISLETPTPGMSIYTIGDSAGLERSFSTGVVSGILEFGGRGFLQISSPVAPGSSGGPVLNRSGEVVGVALGTVDTGQNLTFAVPAALVTTFLKGEMSPKKNDVISILEQADILALRPVQYSTEPDSEWKRLERQVAGLLQTAVEQAGDNPELLLKIAEKAELDHADIAISAARRAVLVKPTWEANLLLGRSLKSKAIFAEDSEKPALWDLAEKALRSAMQMTKQPTAELHYHLADVLEELGAFAEAEGNFRSALDLGKASGNTAIEADSVRGLVRTAYSLKRPADGDAWFQRLVTSGKATPRDWELNGKRLYQRGQFKEAGRSYQQAAELGGRWTTWCQAADSFTFAPGEEESVLACAHKCLGAGTGKKDSEAKLAGAHGRIADVLNRRGAYQEALNHAREATALDPTSAWAFYSQAESLLGLRRFRESIDASNQAIRLSDGKYGHMHFMLAAAYFEIENWEFAKQSFEKAAQLDPKNDAAAYNVALCLLLLRDGAGAAQWFQEVLRRNPGHPQKEEIAGRIQALRQY